jgi:hypothetical protein
MRPLFALVFALALLSGCAVSSINVLEKKDTPKPFSKILTVYVDADIDFAVFDSLTYDICIRPVFVDTANQQTRVNTEGIISDGLSAPRSVFFKSSDLFGPSYNSYADFNAEMDSLGIDAILLIHLHRYTYTPHQLPDANYPLGPSGGNIHAYGKVSGTYLTPNAAFACYLIRPREYLPLWKAEVDVKGKGFVNGKHILRADMVSNLEKTLVLEGYIAPHLKE